LKPLHDLIFSVLAKIPNDGTFDQGKPLEFLRDITRGERPWFSYDLSSATDRLPALFQRQVLILMLGPEYADA